MASVAVDWGFGEFLAASSAAWVVICIGWPISCILNTVSQNHPMFAEITAV